MIDFINRFNKKLQRAKEKRTNQRCLMFMLTATFTDVQKFNFFFLINIVGYWENETGLFCKCN